MWLLINWTINKLNTVITITKITRYIEKKVSLYLLCDVYVSIIADGTSVSAFLCIYTKAGARRSVSLIAV